MPVLTLENLSHRFGTVQVLDDLNLTIDAGEVLCLLGPSGSGKSTALRIAAGLEPPQSGIVRIGERIMSSATVNVPPEQRDIGLMFQDYALFPHLTVAKNVEFGLTGQGAEERRKIAREMLANVGMAGFENGFPYTLSGGEQQRVALARALAPNPHIMLMDEPFSGLDFRLRDQIRDDTLALLKSLGTATLLVTHDPEEAMLMADRIALLDRGRVVQAGTAEDLYTRPLNGFVAEFFGEINRLEGKVEAGGVATRFGALPARGLDDGCPVDILIRPRGLEIDPDGGSQGARATVINARLVGPDSLIDLMLDHTDISLRARIPGAVLPEIGASVGVTLDQSQAFVFAKAGRET